MLSEVEVLPKAGQLLSQLDELEVLQVTLPPRRLVAGIFAKAFLTVKKKYKVPYRLWKRDNQYFREVLDHLAKEINKSTFRLNFSRQGDEYIRIKFTADIQERSRYYPQKHIAIVNLSTDLDPVKLKRNLSSKSGKLEAKTLWLIIHEIFDEALDHKHIPLEFDPEELARSALGELLERPDFFRSNDRMGYIRKNFHTLEASRFVIKRYGKNNVQYKKYVAMLASFVKAWARGFAL